jgi:hypothetical protein
MEPEGSLPCTQQPATGPYPQPDESSPHIPPYLRMFHSNIIFPSTPRSSKWSLSFRRSKQYRARNSHLSNACYMSRPSYPHFPLPMSFQRVRPIPRPCVTFRNNPVFMGGSCKPPPNPQTGWPPLAGCPRPLIQYIRDYPPHLEAVGTGPHTVWPNYPTDVPVSVP